MNLPVMCQNIYSVEQVEFVRRLRSSGLNRDQVLAIWDRLDRIDAELGQQAAHVFPPAFSAANHSREFLQLLQQERHQQASALMMMQMQQILSSSSTPSSSTPKPLVGSNGINNNNNNNNNNSNSNNNKNSDAAQSSSENQGPNNNDSNSTSQTANEPLALATKQEQLDSSLSNIVNAEVPARLVDENDPELVEFLRKNNEPQICEQIRHFIALNGIKQHQVAVLVGTSQSYISKYLKADYLEMSERSRRNIYRWYVTYRNQPNRAIGDACAVIANPLLQQHSLSTSALPLTAANAAAVPLTVNNNNNSLPLYPVSNDNNVVSTTAVNNNGTVSPGIGNNVPGSPRSTSSSSFGNGNNIVAPITAANSNVSSWNFSSSHLPLGNTNSGGSATSHRRFRFTFRAQQLAILERAFSEDTYPTVERREELARQLSQGLEGEQAVSLFTVTNWFANRRKEAKRAAVEEGLNVEELGMKRGRGRPSILHRMASAQLRETRQNSSAGGVQLLPGDSSSNTAANRLLSSADTNHQSSKRARKTTDDDEEDTDRGMASDGEDGESETQSLSPAAGDAPDDLSSSSTGGANYRQQAADLAVFPTPELIAS